jgi:aryl-alcohol dehydrogenase-like predicted oxidoreductase
MSPENLAKNAPFVDLLRRIAAQKDATPAQVALAWLLAQKPWIVPIPGTRRLDHLEENLGATAVELTALELRQMSAELATLTVHGRRMDEDNMKLVEG